MMHGDAHSQCGAKTRGGDSLSEPAGGRWRARKTMTALWAWRNRRLLEAQSSGKVREPVM